MIYLSCSKSLRNMDSEEANAWAQGSFDCLLKWITQTQTGPQSSCVLWSAVTEHPALWVKTKSGIRKSLRREYCAHECSLNIRSESNRCSNAGSHRDLKQGDSKLQERDWHDPGVNNLKQQKLKREVHYPYHLPLFHWNCWTFLLHVLRSSVKRKKKTNTEGYWAVINLSLTYGIGARNTQSVQCQGQLKPSVPTETSFSLHCTAPQMAEIILARKWSPDQKWSPNWTANGETQMNPNPPSSHINSENNSYYLTGFQYYSNKTILGALSTKIADHLESVVERASCMKNKNFHLIYKSSLVKYCDTIT